MRFRGRVARLLDRGAGSVMRFRVRERVAALTFDDGPDPDYTPAVLDVLARHQARATFFVLGKCAAAHPGILERAAAEGHCIANHSWDHPSFPTLPAAERFRQLRRCQQAIAPFGVRVFRPPRSLQTAGSYLSTRAAGFQVMIWSVEIEDWVPQVAGELEEKLRSRLFPGAIVLLHDRLESPTFPEARDRQPLLEALDRFLSVTRSTYQFRGIDELLRTARPVTRRWFVASDDAWNLLSTSREDIP